MTTPQEAWQQLTETVVAFYEGDRDDMAVKRRLHDGVLAYVAARGGAAPKVENRAPVSGNSGAVFPNYGKAKGQPIAGASMADLEYYLRGCERTLADPSKERWHQKERELAAVIRAEMAR